ncbi:MAG: T9SS type B sorting domain-containing protein, partial [Sphingobacteriales bacterium]
TVRAPLPVRVVKTPVIGLTKSADGCVPVNFNLSGNLLNADTAVMNWQWTFSDGRVANGRQVNAMPFATSGVFAASLVATNSSGCKDTATAQLQAFALPVVNAGADKTICQGTGQTITATGASSYSWSPATGLNCTNCAAPVATPAAATTYYVTGRSAQGCIGKDSITISVKYPFEMVHNSGDTLCAGESTQLTASGAAVYAWSPAAGLNATNRAAVQARPSASTNYMLVGTDELGCFKDTAFFPVKVYPIPTVNAGSDVTMNVGQTRTLTPIISADVTAVNWSPTGGIFRTDYPSIDIKPKQTTTYRVEVSNPGGCTATDNLTVQVLCNGANVFIPNTFSPNGDGVNEEFYPRGTGLFRIKSARIYNRWGELVYEKFNVTPNESAQGWNGTYKGQKLAPDVFVYMFEIMCENDEVLVYKGDIALIR